MITIVLLFFNQAKVIIIFHSPLSTSNLKSFRLEQVLDTANTAHKVGCLVWQVNGLGLVARRHFLKHLYILLRQKVVGRIGALAHGLGDFLYGDSLDLGLAYASLRLALVV